MLLAAAVLLGNTRCQTTTNGLGPDGPVFVTSLAVQDANGNAASSFASGQQIQFVLSVRNRSGSSQTLSFDTAQQYNFAVLASGTSTVVWTWSGGQVFNPSASSLSFQAGETKTFTITWNQLDSLGQLVAAGNYEAIGGLTCNTGSTGSSSASLACMPAGVPSSDQLAPSVYVSTLVPFAIR